MELKLLKQLFKKPQVNIVFSITFIDDVDFKEILPAVKDNLGFEPYQVIHRQNPCEDFFHVDYWDILLRENSDSITIDDKDKQSYFLYTRNQRYKQTSLHWNPTDFQKIDLEKILSLTKHPKFTTAYLYDSTDVSWQSTTFVSNYETQGKPHSHLPKIKDKTYGQLIDIRYNPGRSKMVECMWLMAVAEMWFGKSAFKFLPKQKLLSFPDAQEIKELENEVIYVKLFDVSANPESYRNRQRSFREWMELDRLEIELDNDPLKDISTEEAEKRILEILKNRKK